ncbi:MAG: S4 domain-containing protein, partial [Candidatus Omnitrophota bacterium]
MLKSMRLNLFISRSGFASRRKADEMIKKGKVQVNGSEINQPWYNVASGDKVTVQGEVIKEKKYVYLVFYKPKGVTATLKDRFASRSLADYIPDRFKGVFPVGRLDKNSEGLLILTNDGRLSFNLSHP